METALEILKFAWKVMNSPAGITVFATVVLFIVNKIYARKPLWKKYQGTLIAAVKFAEKEIPDDTPIPSVARLDAALKYALRVIESAEGLLSPEKVVEVREGLQITHAELEAKGGITNGRNPA